MSNSEHILQTLNSVLDKPLPITLHLLGGAALELVYELPRFSEDVDAMCTMGEAAFIDTDDFQNALRQTNSILEPEGLYITHVFDETGLVHTEDWVERLVAPNANSPRFEKLKYNALSPEDIIISKITRCRRQGCSRYSGTDGSTKSCQNRHRGPARSRCRAGCLVGCVGKGMVAVVRLESIDSHL